MLKRIKFNQSDINVLLFKIKPFGVLVARSVVISLRRNNNNIAARMPNGFDFIVLSELHVKKSNYSKSDEIYYLLNAFRLDKKKNHSKNYDNLK